MAKILSISTAIAGAMLALASSLGAEAGEFDGVTVNVMTQTGAIQEPLQRRAPEFEKLTGSEDQHDRGSCSPTSTRKC